MTRYRPLLIIWVMLLLLLGLTVGLSFALTGPASLAAGLLIAAAKAGLVYWFFMHLDEESGIIRIAALGALFWLAILLLISASDFATR